MDNLQQKTQISHKTIFIFLIVIVCIGTAISIYSIYLSTQKADKYSDWQTYQNEEYGFQVMAPKDFEVSEAEGSVTFNIPLETYFITQLPSEAVIKVYLPPKRCSVTEEINGQVFQNSPVKITRKLWGDVGAGQVYSGIEYTVYDRLCYTVLLHTRSAGSAGFFIDNFDEIQQLDALHATDMMKIKEISDEVMSTWRSIHY